MTRGWPQGAALLAAITLSACATTQPGVRVKTVTVTKEVQRPCAVKPIERPAKLTRPLPTDAIALALTLQAKLLEYAGPGGWAERMEGALAICTKEN